MKEIEYLNESFPGKGLFLADDNFRAFKKHKFRFM